MNEAQRKEVTKMLQSERNRLFEEKIPLIDQVVKKHQARIAISGLCREDVWQDLALKMLCLLDGYDPGKCPNLDGYLVQQLNYEVLRLTVPSERYGIPHAPRKKNFRVFSLDARNSGNGHVSRAVPVKVVRKQPVIGVRKPFRAVRRRLRCWLKNQRRREAVPCA